MDDKKKLVSVVIPSYNRAETISASLESVLAQTYINLEVIVVDDGSGDDTGDIMKPYLGDRVRYYRYTPNRGACFARNWGAKHARGVYLAFQDSDDLWHRDKIEKQVAHLEDSGAEFVFCGLNRMAETGERYYFPVHPFQNEGNALEQILYENRVSTQTMLMHTYVWENIQFDVTFMRYQDWDFALRVAGQYRMSYLGEALVDSAVGRSSISASVPSWPALYHLYKKYQKQYERMPSCRARMYRRMGRRLTALDPAAAGHYFRMGFALGKNPMDLLRTFACRIRIYVG